MKTKIVKPYGMLYSQGREYFLLEPHPIVKDWEGDNAYRFLVVPRKKLWFTKDEFYYPTARHIVTNAFVVDIVDAIPEIQIRTGDE
jgi:hypothetical protein